MSNHLPKEIIDHILSYLPFELLVILGDNYVVKKEYISKVHTWSWAARNGHLCVIKWLHRNKMEGCTQDAMDWAAKYGHLEVVEWLHNNRMEGCNTYAMDWAAANGHLEVVEFLHSNRTEGCTRYAMNWAASANHLEIVKWLHFNRTEGFTRDAMNYAAGNGKLDTVKWLYFNTKVCTKDAIKSATQDGYIEIANWIRHEMNKFPVTNEVEFTFLPKKKIMKEVHEEERCVSLRKDGERCTKRHTKDGNKCSIHEKTFLHASTKEIPLVKTKCCATTQKGEPCKKNAIDNYLCSIHLKNQLRQ